MGLGFGTPQPGVIPPVILDTDLSEDADDATDALALAEFHNQRKLQIIAGMTSTSNAYAPGCLDALFTHMGLTIPIGTWKGASMAPNSLFTQTVYDGFSHPNTGLASSVTDLMTLYATVLAARTSADVTIITTGWLKTMSALLAAQPTLVATKVRRLIVVAGNNNGTEEANISGDRAAAADVAAHWPTELIQVPCTIGNAIGVIGGSLSHSCPGWVAINAQGYPGGEPAWSPSAFDLAAGNTDLYTLTAGTWSVNASTGVDTFTPGAGTHKIMSLVNAAGTYQTRFNAILAMHAL